MMIACMFSAASRLASSTAGSASSLRWRRLAALGAKYELALARKAEAEAAAAAPMKNAANAAEEFSARLQPPILSNLPRNIPLTGDDSLLFQGEVHPITLGCHG